MKHLADTYAVPAYEMTSAFAHVFVEPTGKVNVFAGWEEGEITLVRLRLLSVELLARLTLCSSAPRRGTRWTCWRIPVSIGSIRCFWSRCRRVWSGLTIRSSESRLGT